MNEIGSPSTAIALRDAQAGFWDREVVDGALYQLFEACEKGKAAANQYGRDVKKRREAIDLLAAPEVDGGEARLRGGSRLLIKSPNPEDVPFVVEMTERSGGGFEIPEWHRISPGKISRLEE